MIPRIPPPSIDRIRVRELLRLVERPARDSRDRVLAPAREPPRRAGFDRVRLVDLDMIHRSRMVWPGGERESAGMAHSPGPRVCKILVLYNRKQVSFDEDG